MAVEDGREGWKVARREPRGVEGREGMVEKTAAAVGAVMLRERPLGGRGGRGGREGGREGGMG